ncbi:hypothetical protein A2Z33_07225 [Candidatus Gottesmanbacteria bacterium RBG_16_52_11]|uniref:Probable 2-phosphosulfolactate phosphatase n=1 Tax=Candidatus Gottesmanbacteria bacterium RBG_16_52_11 TaxID=1798374 RepID=A0A1F5YY32_9BACT|nr:MAG: hypothetical protein A2Z33_07225 [Candidatus Gottesmanbacteria bacterium RBG_16_52_11]
MKILRYWHWDMPQKINGAAVFVDVFAAATNIALILSKFPTVIILVNRSNIDAMRRKYPDSVLIGESASGHIRFDYPHMPVSFIDADLMGKTVLFMSINGTAVVEKALATGAAPVLIAGYVNMSATLRFLRTLQIPECMFLMSGDENSPTVEDEKFVMDFSQLANGGIPDWSTSERDSRTFMSGFYGRQADDPNFSIVFSRDKYPYPAVCRKNPDGSVVLYVPV